MATAEPDRLVEIGISSDRTVLDLHRDKKSTLNEAAQTPSQTETQPVISLPDEPLVVIEPSQSWVPLNLRDLWAYRELFYFLTWRDVKVRYKQTALGVAWAVLQPLCTMIIFTIFFGRFAKMPSDGIPYPIFAFAGLLPWMFFSNSITNSGNSLVGSQNLITKVYFPRMIIPGAAVGAGLVDLMIAFALLVPMMFYYQIELTWNILMLPLLILLIALLATGVGMLMSALNVKYRDIRYALPFFIQLGMFISPVIYPPSFVPEQFHWLLNLNPLTGIIDGFRSALFGREFNGMAIAISIVITLVVLTYSAYTFRRMEKSFADVV